MNAPAKRSEEFPVSFFLKRGTLLGAALGMLVGLVYLSFVGVGSSEEIASIVVWRNCILIGAAVGFVLGGALGWWHQSSPPEIAEEHRRDKSNTGKQKTIP